MIEKIKKRLRFLTGFLAFVLTFTLLISSVQGLMFRNQFEYDNLPVSLNQNNYNYLNDFYAVPAAVSLPTAAAQGAILIDTDSGDIIYEVNSRKRLPMASTTKIMTAVVAIESGIVEVMGWNQYGL